MGFVFMVSNARKLSSRSAATMMINLSFQDIQFNGKERSRVEAACNSSPATLVNDEWTSWQIKASVPESVARLSCPAHSILQSMFTELCWS